MPLSSTTSAAMRSSASGRAHASIASRIRARRASSAISAEMRLASIAGVERRLEHDLGAARALDLSSVGVLMVLGRVRIRHQDRRHAAGR